jgi:two-component system LytT family response regulator
MIEAAPLQARRLRVLVVDDEPLGRRRLLDLLAQEPDVDVIGTAVDGVAAIEGIKTLSPDIVFLDVQMPRVSGLDVVRMIGVAAMPATVFVTAHDQYALHAFESAAVDYLVKPFRDDRFEEALRRVRRRVASDDRERVHEQLLALLGGDAAAATTLQSAVDQAMTSKSSAYLKRIAVEMPGKMRVVPVSQIDYVTASGPYAELHVGAHRYVIRESMQRLEEQLDPERFLRIHRSAIVRLDLVEVLLRSEGSEYHVQLKTGVTLRVSRSRREQLEQRLGKSR